jgi:hypothetical protein
MERFTPKGFSVISLIRRISFRNPSQVGKERLEMIPSPPAFETAEAS